MIQMRTQKKITAILVLLMILNFFVFNPKKTLALECIDTSIPVTNPYASTEVSGKLYVTGENSGTVTIIDLATHTTLQTLNLGIELYYRPARVGNFLYYSDSVSDVVYVVDTTTDTVVTTIPVGRSPKFSILVGTKLYVHNTRDTFISVINTNTNTVLTTISMEGANQPRTSVLIGNRLFVNRTGVNGVAEVDTITDTVIGGGVVAAPDVEHSVAVGTKLYTNSGTQPNMYVTETLTTTGLGPLELGSIPLYSIAVALKVYVSLTPGGFGINSLGIIDSITDALTTTVDTGQSSQYMTQVGTKLYISDDASNSVFIFDTTTDSVIGTVSVENNPRYSTAVGNKVYVPNMGSNTISIINNNTNALFVCPTYAVTYTANTGGSVDGTVSQTIVEGFDATTVTAVANTGYTFSGWSDGISTVSRTDNDVVSNVTVTALFSPIATATPPSSSGGNININNSILQPTPQATLSANPPTVVSPLDGGTLVCNPFKSYLKFNSYKNIVSEVMLWQAYLNKFHNENLSLTGFYDTPTFEAMKRFQSKYKTEILAPWNLQSATGYTYKTTRAKANQLLGCPEGELLLENGNKVNIQ